MKIENYVSAKGPAAAIQDVLECWVDIVHRMYDESRGARTPYSYKERPNVGVFANAAAVKGWRVLEEFSVGKERDGRRYDGRIDLLIWRGRRSLAFEAKLASNSPSILPKHIRSYLKAAVKDAGKLPSGIARARFATVFGIPRFPHRASSPEVTKGVLCVIESCRDLDVDFMAYAFPGKVWRMSPDSKDSDMCAYGIIVLGKAV